jgi:predicted DsbA family dithiol-disulfide isomerase
MFRGRGFDLEAAHARMRKLMDAEGLPFHPQDKTYNSRLAQELGKWGGTRAPGLHDALYRAYFAEGRNVSDVGVLLDVAQAQGLPRDEAEQVLADRTFSGAVDADWQRARGLGVTGVPTFVAGKEGVVGAQPYEVLEALVLAAGAQLRG